VRTRPDRIEATFKEDLATLQGQSPVPQFQNRILAPGVLYAARKLLPASVKDTSVWYLARFLQAAISYVILYGVVVGITGSCLRALFAVGLVTYAYLWTTMSHHAEISSDFFDVGFAALMVGLALAERYYLLLLVVVLAAINRESAAFAGVISMCIAALRYGVTWREWPRFVPGLIYIPIAAAVVLGVRASLSPVPQMGQHLGVVDFVNNGRALFHPTGWLPMLAATVLAYAAVLWRLPSPWTADQRALFIATLICAVITFVLGIAYELRVWLPCWVILAMITVIGDRSQSDRDWLLGFLVRKR
jgi:hypothetical protein